MRKIDLKGLRFGMLYVDEQSTERGNRNQIRWRCVCSCGRSKVISGESLRGGITKSCGCARKQMLRDKNSTHGMSRSRIYRTYRHMINRCNNKNVDMYPIYGGRGINVCGEWSEFAAFFSWAKDNGYKKHLTLDRVDNDKGYSPENCRWATITEQQRNKRNNVLTIEKAIEIRRLRSIGERNIDIARKFNISQSLTSDVFKNKIWKI